jgi:hypothetical protein
LFKFFDMEKMRRVFFSSGFWVFLLGMILPLFGVLDGGALAAGATVNPAGGGAVGIDEATSVTRTHVDSPDLLLDQIDRKVTKIRPHEVVLDTIARQVSDTKNSTSQRVRHYAIDVIELSATLNTAIAAGSSSVPKLQSELVTSDSGIFAQEQTIFCKGVSGYLEDGTTVDTKNPLVLYVVGVSANGNPLAIPINGPKISGNINFPAIPAGTLLTRGGRAGSESQMKTDAYSGVPTDFEQYLQKFMAQIEQTTLHKIAEKEVDWDFSDLEEEAIFDMRRTQNITYWTGVKRVIKAKNAHAKKAEEIYFTGGIWNQAGKDYSFGGNPVDENNIVGLMKTAFVGNASSKTKTFIVGSDLLEKFEQVDYHKVVYAGTRKQVYGLEFSQIISKFGTLNVIHDQTLNDLGWSDRGFILDQDFLRKWTMGWRVENFDLRGTGEADADARALIEICGLVLKNPEAHTRVYLS